MIHRYEEGAEPRWGINIGRRYLVVLLHRRLMLWANDSNWGFRLDLTRDHQMYRPSDVDYPSLRCRRCGYLPSHMYNNYCSGRIIVKRWWRHGAKSGD